MQKKKIDIFDYIFLNISSGPDEANSHEGNISKRLIFFWPFKPICCSIL